MAPHTGKRLFAPGLAVTLATLALVVAFASLGRWQIARMHEKEALFAAYDSGAAMTVNLSLVPPGSGRFQRVSAIGRYDSDHQFLLDNMTSGGRAGLQVLTPLVIDEGRTVLVNRGWVPLARREDLPAVSVAANERIVSGRLSDFPRAGIELEAPPAPASAPWPRVVSYPRQEQLEQALGRPVYPGLLQLDTDQPDGFVREWRPSTFPPERHLGYAVTWFALAATVLVVYVFTNLRRRPAGDTR